jgi:2-octaprenyl-3-methyl-6-methoxy-1,4-benzoquinol hydroxylase
MDNKGIVIVGGGMVGAALAVDLGQRGIPVRLLEARPPQPPTADESPRLRVSALNQRSVEYLQTLTAWSALQGGRIADFDEVLTWDVSGGGRLRFTALELGLERLGVFLENEHLQATLLEIARTLPAVRVDAPVEGLEIEPSEDGPRLVIDGEGVVDAALIVAADGGGSPLREAAGIGSWQGDYHQHAVVASVRTNPAATTCTWQRFTPTGPQALLPLAGGDASLVWYVDPSRAESLAQLDADAFVHELETAFPQELGLVETLHGRAHFPIRRRHARRYWQGNLVLVGDSAHVIHPLAGQGVNLGLRDARELASRIAEAHRLGLPPSHPPLLAAYERARRPDNQLMQSTMSAFHYGFTAPLGPLAGLRSMGLRLAGHGGWVKRRVLRYALEGR